MIVAANVEAGQKSDTFGTSVTAEVRRVLDANGDLRSVEGFAKSNNIDLTLRPAPLSEEVLRQEVERRTTPTSNGLSSALEERPPLSAGQSVLGSEG